MIETTPGACPSLQRCLLPTAGFSVSLSEPSPTCFLEQTQSTDYMPGMVLRALNNINSRSLLTTLRGSTLLISVLSMRMGHRKVKLLGQGHTVCVWWGQDSKPGRPLTDSAQTHCPLPPPGWANGSRGPVRSTAQGVARWQYVFPAVTVISCANLVSQLSSINRRGQ